MTIEQIIPRATRRKNNPKMPAAPGKRLTPAELAMEQEITAHLKAAVVALRHRSLERAVLLAQRAVAGQLDAELTKHFSELGARFASLLEAPARPTLRAIAGGRA